MPIRSRWLTRAASGLDRIAQRRKLWIALIGLASLGGSAILALATHIPEPAIHDEFSYLLAADTFAHGRAANPTHPLWEHFESFHILQQPTYASKYPPAQGLVLALGQVLTGHPIAGVWLSAGLACAAIYWMLCAWLPPRWALLGGLLVVMRVGILGNWAQSYWGGAVTAIGGALVFGALRHILRSLQVRDAFLLGAGLAILANSRPYEGLLASLPVGAILAIWMLGRHGPPMAVSFRRLVLPLLLVLLCTAGAMGGYNHRVTGSAFRLPYLVHEETYGMAPLFLCQAPKPELTYRHEVMREFHTGDPLSTYIQGQSIRRHLRTTLSRLRNMLMFYLGPVLAVSFLGFPWLLRNRWMRFALAACGVLGAGLLLETWMSPHYAAPVTGLIFVLVLQALRHLRLWGRHRWPGGRILVAAILLACLASFGAALVQQLQRGCDRGAVPRSLIVSRLKAIEGRHLVIVRYGPGHSPHREWVYNEADIDGAAVVWAREMDPARNRRLLEYFADRRPWLLEPDTEELRLTPYPAEPR